MRILLDRIEAEPTQWQEAVDIPPAELDEHDLLELGQISWQGRVWKGKPGYRLEARLSYWQKIACVRCLTAVEQAVDSEVKLVILTEDSSPDVDEVELTADDLDVLYLKGVELDTDPILREQLQLNIPMRLLCDEECQGLCPNCGTNRNLDSCDCETTPMDPRWQVLRGLKQEE